MSARKISLLVLGLISVCGLAACEGVKSPTFISKLERIDVCVQPGNGVCPENACTTSNAVRAAGFDVQFCAVGTFSGLGVAGDATFIPPKTRDITNSVVWSSANPAFASVAPSTGLVRAQAATPSVAIRATSGSIVGTTLLRVTDALLTELEMVPQVLRRTVVGRVTPFTCNGTFSGAVACGGVNPRQCDVTKAANWSSDDAAVFSINNTTDKGLGTAVSPGLTSVSCEVVNREGNLIRPAQPSAVSVCSVESQQLTITPAGPVNLVKGTSRDLSLRGDFVGDCGSGRESFSLDLTQSAVWASDRPTIVSVSNSLADRSRGRISAGDPGLANVSASFGGQSASIRVFSVNGAIESVKLSGPNFLFSGFTGQYTATPMLRDADTGDLIAGAPITVSPDIIWASSAPSVVSFPNNDGLALVAENVPSQQVTVTANYQGVTGSLDTLIANAELQGVQVRPKTVCISSTGQFTGDLEAQLEADGIFSVDAGPGEPVQCRLPVTQLSDWQVVPDSTSGCEQGLPFAFSSDPESPPVVVSNVAPTKGLVSARLGEFFGEPVVAGSACVQGALRGFAGHNTTVVTLELTPACEQFAAQAFADGGESTLAECVTIFAPPAAEGAEAAATEEGAGMFDELPINVPGAP